MGSTEGNENSQTVVFNVGGKVYEISTSLLKSFPDRSVMVQKAASTTDSSPIFIDRDPERFAYCLDYVRDNGRVYLTDHVSKDSLLEDFKLFGLENLDDSRIHCDAASKRQTGAKFQTNVGQLLCKLDNMRKDITSRQQEIERLQNKIEMGELALKCLSHTAEGRCRNERGTEVCNELDEAYFSECCEKIGLQASATFRNGLSRVTVASENAAAKDS